LNSEVFSLLQKEVLFVPDGTNWIEIKKFFSSQSPAIANKVNNERYKVIDTIFYRRDKGLTMPNILESMNQEFKVKLEFILLRIYEEKNKEVQKRQFARLATSFLDCQPEQQRVVEAMARDMTSAEGTLPDILRKK